MSRTQLKNWSTSQLEEELRRREQFKAGEAKVVTIELLVEAAPGETLSGANYTEYLRECISRRQRREDRWWNFTEVNGVPVDFTEVNGVPVE